MTIDEYLKQIFQSTEALDKQLFKDCIPSDKTIQQNAFSGYIDQSIKYGYKLSSEWYQGKRDGVAIVTTKRNIPIIKLPFLNGNLHGSVQFINKTRNTTVEYKEGVPTGVVRIIDGERRVFDGKYLSGKPNGVCYCENESGLIYQGNMELGVAKGYGELLDYKGCPYYKGTWENGKSGSYTFVFENDLLFMKSYTTPFKRVPKKTLPTLLSKPEQDKLSYYHAYLSLCEDLMHINYTGYRKAYQQYSNRYNTLSSSINDYWNVVHFVEEMKKTPSSFYHYGKTVAAILSQSSCNKALLQLFGEYQIEESEEEVSEESEEEETTEEEEEITEEEEEITEEEEPSEDTDDTPLSSDDSEEPQPTRKRGALIQHLNNQIIKPDDEDLAMLEDL